MRVWIVNHYAIPPKQAGGTRHFSLARELVRRGHEVSLIASSFSHGTRSEAHLGPGAQEKVESVDGVSFVWVKTPPYSGNTVARIRNMLSFSLRVWLRIPQLHLTQPDIVVGSSPHLFAALAAQRLAVSLGVPFVLEVRDLWPQSFVDLGVLSPRHPLVIVLGLIERYLYSHASSIVTLLPGSIEHLVAKGAARNKVTWIPNGIDLNLAGPATPAAPSSGLRVVYAGAHGHANGLDALLDAARILGAETRPLPIKIALYGEGPEKARLQKRVETERIPAVEFHEPVPKSDIYAVLKEADAFVLTLKDSPLYRWGISLNKLYDYLACARPIVFGANSPYNPVAEARAGIVTQPENGAAIAAALLEVASMAPGERQAAGLRGRAYVEQYHAMEILGGKLEALLEQTLSARKGAELA